MKTVTKKAEKKVSKMTAEQSEARALKFQQSDYYNGVLLPSKAIKAVSKSLGGQRALILGANGQTIKIDINGQMTDYLVNLSVNDVKLLKATKSNEAYKIFILHSRESKAGNYSAFWIMQNLHNPKKRTALIDDLNKIGIINLK